MKITHASLFLTCALHLCPHSLSAAEAIPQRQKKKESLASLIKRSSVEWVDTIAAATLPKVVYHIFYEPNISANRKTMLLKKILMREDAPIKQICRLFDYRSIELIPELPPRQLARFILNLFFHNFGCRPTEKHACLRKLENSSDVGLRTVVSFLLYAHTPSTLDSERGRRSLLGICPRLLHEAILTDQLKTEDERVLVLQELLAQGLPVDAVDIHRATPLYYAVTKEFVQCIRLLLAHGAKAHHQRKPLPEMRQRISPLEYIIQFNGKIYPVLEKILPEEWRTPSPYTAPSKILTPIDYATHQKLPEILSLLTGTAQDELEEASANETNSSTPNEAQLRAETERKVYTQLITENITVLGCLPQGDLPKVLSLVITDPTIEDARKSNYLSYVLGDPKNYTPRFAQIFDEGTIRFLHNLAPRHLIPIAFDIFFLNWSCHFDSKNNLIHRILQFYETPEAAREDGVTKELFFLAFLFCTNDRNEDIVALRVRPPRHDGQVCPRLLHEAAMINSFREYRGNSVVPAYLTHRDCINRYRIDLIAMLHGRGLDVGALDLYNRTPLFYAVLRNDPLCTSVLLQRGADPTLLDEAPEQLGTTTKALQEARIFIILSYGKPERQYLGANSIWDYPGVKGKMTSRTPLDYAEAFGFKDIVKILNVATSQEQPEESTKEVAGQSKQASSTHIKEDTKQ